MRIELTFPDQSQETADLKSGTGTSTVTSPNVATRLCMIDDKRFNAKARLQML